MVSIGLATRNGARYIREALDSLLEQTYGDFELIVSDNASSDETPKICREYAARDRRIRYFRQSENIGALLNYNFVLKEARGNYFMWASDDDIWKPTFIERCVGILGKEPDVIVAFSAFEDFDDYGNVRERDPKRAITTKKDCYGRLKEFLLFDWDDDKADVLYGLWRLDRIKNRPLVGWGPRHEMVGWGFEILWIFKWFTESACDYAWEVLFRKRAKGVDFSGRRLLRPKRSTAARIIRSLVERARKIPFFWKLTAFVAGCKRLTPSEKLRLLFWTFFAMSRLFWRRKM